MKRRQLLRGALMAAALSTGLASTRITETKRALTWIDQLHIRMAWATTESFVRSIDASYSGKAARAGKEPQAVTVLDIKTGETRTETEEYISPDDLPEIKARAAIAKAEAIQSFARMVTEWEPA